MSEEDMIFEQLGGESAEKVARSMAEYADSARVLSECTPRFIDEYPEKWIAVYRGEVAAAADTLESVASKAVAKGIRAEDLIIRHITREDKLYFF